MAGHRNKRSKRDSTAENPTAQTAGGEGCAMRSREASRCMVAGKSTGSVTRRCRRSVSTQLASGTPLVEAEAELGQAEITGPPPRPEATVAIWM
jgi:hypothetical protein